MKPSEVRLDPIPLVGGFKKTEAEMAAALIIHVCQVRGDEWQAVKWKDIQDTFKPYVADHTEPFVFWVTNPFVRPDLFRLIDDGFSMWIDEESQSIKLTEAALSILTKYTKEPHHAG